MPEQLAQRQDLTSERILAITAAASAGCAVELINPDSEPPKNWNEFTEMLHTNTLNIIRRHGLPESNEAMNINFSYGIMSNLIRYAIWAGLRAKPDITVEELRDSLLASFETIAAPLMGTSRAIAHHIETELGIFTLSSRSQGKEMRFDERMRFRFTSALQVERINRLTQLISEGRESDTKGSCGGFDFNRMSWPFIITAAHNYGLIEAELQAAKLELC